MAQNEIKVKITADSSALERTLANVKKRVAQTFSDPSAFSLNSISPWKAAADLISKSVTYVIDTFRNAGEELKKQGNAIRDEAKAIDASVESVATLKAAATAAGVGAQAYADALERIKAGETTLDKQVEAWKNIATNAAFTEERARNFAAIRIAQEERDKKNMIEQMALDARVKDEDRLRADLDELARLYASRGERHGLGVKQLDQLVNNRLYDIDELTLSKMPGFFYAQQDAYLREYEDRQKAEASAREAQADAAKKAEWARDAERNARFLSDLAEQTQTKALLKAEEDRVRKKEEEEARRLFVLYELRAGVVGAGASRTGLANELNIAPERLERLLSLGEALTLTPEERFRRQTHVMNKEREAERERQAEAEAERTRLAEREADLQKRIRETEGELSASWMTSAGGSLIGGGSFALAMAERMRAIDREEKQREMVEELRGVREELRKIVRNTNE